MPHRKLAPLDLKPPPRDPSKPDMRVCKVCGQSYDATRLDAAYHHTSEPHEPTATGLADR